MQNTLTSFIGDTEKEIRTKNRAAFQALEGGPGVFVIRNLYEA